MYEIDKTELDIDCIDICYLPVPAYTARSS
jgi:hypothetical protein